MSSPVKPPSKVDQVFLAIFGEKLPTLQCANGNYSTEKEVVNFWLYSTEKYKVEHGRQRLSGSHKNDIIKDYVLPALKSQWKSKVLKSDKTIKKAIADLLERVEDLKSDVSNILISKKAIAEQQAKFKRVFDIELKEC